MPMQSSPPRLSFTSASAHEIRAARENTGFTLEQVSRETRVHISHLRAIEE